MSGPLNDCYKAIAYSWAQAVNQLSWGRRSRLLRIDKILLVEVDRTPFAGRLLTERDHVSSNPSGAMTDCLLVLIDSAEGARLESAASR